MSSRKAIVVFGSSTCETDSDAYRTAEELGTCLARSGYNVVTGGYSGTMEAVSKGASAESSAIITGVIVPELFPKRPTRGNAYLNNIVVTRTLMERLTRLLLESNIFIALPGSVGTIGELALVWNHISIDFRVNQASKMHLVLWRQPFQRFVEDSVKSLGLATMDTNNIHFVDDPQEALTLVKTLTGA